MPKSVICLAAFLLALSAGSCATTSGGSALKNGEVAYSDRGAKGNVKGNIQDINTHAEQVFQNLGIQLTSTEMKGSGDDRELVGQSNGDEVTVKLTAGDNNTTHIEAVAKNGAQSWDKEYAKNVVSQIVATG
jgi:hypothetical protein